MSERNPMGFIISMTVLGLIVALALVGVVMSVLNNRRATASPLNQKERRELSSARQVLDEVKDLAYEYRDLDSNLSYRLIETIKRHENRKELR